MMPSMTYTRFKSMGNFTLISSDEESEVKEPLLDEEGDRVFDNNGEPVQSVKRTSILSTSFRGLSTTCKVYLNSLMNPTSNTTQGNEMRLRRLKC